MAGDTHTTMYWLIYLGLCLCLCVSWVSSGFVAADFNFFLNRTETKRLIGVDGELSYVRDGDINTYALSHNMRLKEEVNDLYFTWQSKSGIPYELEFHSSNSEALKPITVNVPLEGRVPRRETAFVVHLECTRRITTSVLVQIELQVRLHNSSAVTHIYLNRTMVCLMDPRLLGSPEGLKPYLPGEEEADGEAGDKVDDKAAEEADAELGDDDQQQVSPALVTDERTDSTRVFYISIASVCGAIIVIALIVAVWYVRRNKNHEHLSAFSETSSNLLNKNPYPARPNTPTLSTTTSGVSKQMGMNQELGVHDVDALIHHIQIDRKRISLRDIILEGAFGRVYQATIYLDTENGSGEHMDVYIKTVTESARVDQTQAMLREGCALHVYHHQNINPLIATCLDNPTQPFLIYPSLSEGNLKMFLQQCKISEYSTKQGLTTQQLVYLATQLARGLHFLHRQHFVHKDIAARNCVVDNQLVVRICDRALARDLFPNDYHCLGDNENRPIKWLSLETLLERRFSYASDVWSFGVTLWEIMTLGAPPYAEVDPFEMAAYLNGGYRVSQPYNCPDELFSVMACCWSLNPSERPQASQLLVCLQDFYSNLRQYI